MASHSEMLIEAAKNGNLELVKSQVKKQEAKLDVQDVTGSTALSRAASNILLAHKFKA